MQYIVIGMPPFPSQYIDAGERTDVIELSIKIIGGKCDMLQQGAILNFKLLTSKIDIARGDT